MNKQQVVIYTRVSTKEQGKSNLGLEAQFKAIQNFCLYNNLEIVYHYSEVQSGGDDDRPQLAKAFAHAKKIGAYVVVSKLDRLSRKASFIMNLMEAGVKFYSAERGLDVEPFMLHLDAILAEKERSTIAQRTKAALQAKKARGEALGGVNPGPEGRNADNAYAIEQSKKAMEAKALAFANKLKKELERMRAHNMTTVEIANEWNERGMLSPRGGNWHPASVTRVLKRLYGAEYKRFGRTQVQQEN